MSEPDRDGYPPRQLPVPQGRLRRCAHPAGLRRRRVTGLGPADRLQLSSPLTQPSTQSKESNGGCRPG